MKGVILFLLLGIHFVSFSQLQETPLNDVDSLIKTSPKNIVVFIHTDWCKYCNKMKHQTFNNDKIIELLNQQFIFCKLDAETKEDISFNQHTFKYVSSGNDTGTHQLATALGTINGELNYPTLCILNSKFEIIFQEGGYLSAKELTKVLETTLK